MGKKRSYHDILKTVLEAVEEAFREKGYVNAYELSARTGLSWHTAKRWLTIVAQITNWGYVLRRGDREGDYVLYRCTRAVPLKRKVVLGRAA